MSFRKILSCMLLFITVNLFLPNLCLSSSSEITSISQLNNPAYRVGADILGPVLERARKNLPNAEILNFNDFISQSLALQNGKIDALVCNESELISAMKNGLENVRILPGYVGEPVPTAAGISERSKIPGLTEKFNAFIAELKADGTLQEMYKRWVDDNNTNMPVIDVPEKSDIHLTIGTTGLVMPFSFYINSDVTGFDVELGRRFAAHIGATVEFKIYGFGSILMALKSGAIDIALSNLYVTPETEESVKFSDVIFNVNCVAVVRDEGKISAGNFSEFNGKRIGVFTGSVQYDMVRKSIPDAEILYFDSIANTINSLTSGKIDAAAIDETIALDIERENPVLTHTNQILGYNKTAFLFPVSVRNNSLLDEINEYIRRMKSDGTLEQIYALWSGSDESKKVIPDYSNFPDTKGVIHIAVDNETPVFSYMKDGKHVGYDVDIILRFCKEKGYRPEFNIINFTGVIPAVNSGKCDMGIGGITITPERSESVRFSEPTCNVRSIMLILKKEPMKKTESRRPKYSSLTEFDGKPIGMQPGIADWEDWVAKNLPHSKVHYFNSYPDFVSALKTHKIEGFLVDSPVLELMAAEDNMLTAVDEPVGEPFGYSFVYALNEHGKKLCDEMSEYIRRIKSNGELDAILSKWQGADEAKKIPPDFKNLPAKNGKLTYAAEGNYPPFNYYKGTKLAGIDIELAVRFCEAYGYGLDVQTMTFDAMIPAVNSGKSDFAGDFTPSDEHEEAVYFSESYCDMRSVMACLKADDSPLYTSEDILAGKTIGVQTGTTCVELVPQKIPSAKLAYYDSLTDQLTALKAGKIDAICCSLPAAIFAQNEDPRLTRINPPLRESYLYPIFAQTEQAKKFCDEYSEFLKKLWDDGTIDALNAKWLGADESKKILDDYSQLPAANGTIKMAVDASMIPFAYMRDNKIVGYDIDLAVMFCKSKGYALVVENMPLTAAIASVKSGKSDFSQSMNQTKERAENTLFTSTPAIKSGNVLLAMKITETQKTDTYTDNHAENENEPSFWDDIALSFRKTFIREDRWNLFIEGIMNTMIITVSSIFFGMLLGFIAFMFCRTGSVIANAITKFSVWLIKGTPIVVLLMILYYVIFGHVNISGIIVSIIAFTLIFGTSVYRMLTFGTGAVDRGQTEAAYALGFTDMQTFFTVILPQAALHFMPSFKEEVTMLIKSTSVVGYIAVQDLTKMGDIVRSRTYEAFFPLIAVAVIYFVLAGMLNIIVNIIHVRITPSKRKAEDILKGIDTSKGDKNHDKA